MAVIVLPGPDGEAPAGACPRPSELRCYGLLGRLPPSRCRWLRS